MHYARQEATAAMLVHRWCIAGALLAMLVHRFCCWGRGRGGVAPVSSPPLLPPPLSSGLTVQVKDVSTFLKAAAEEGLQWDVVVLDPPKLAPNR